jgi:hypothetical protein
MVKYCAAKNENSPLWEPIMVSQFESPPWNAHPDNKQFEQFDTLEAAERYCDRLNGGWGWKDRFIKAKDRIYEALGKIFRRNGT